MTALAVLAFFAAAMFATIALALHLERRRNRGAGLLRDTPPP